MFTYETWISILKIIALIGGITGIIAGFSEIKLLGISKELMIAICSIITLVSLFLVERFKDKLEEINQKGSVLSRTVYQNEKSKISSKFPELEESGIPADEIIEVWMGGNVHGCNLNDLQEGEIKIVSVNGVPPVKIKFRNGVLLVSATVYSFDKRLACEIVDNQWKANPDNVFQCCSDDYGMQIRDANDITCLTVDYVDKQTIKIQAVIPTESVIVIMDNDGMNFHEPTSSISEFRTYAKSISRIFSDHCERY